MVSWVLLVLSLKCVHIHFLHDHHVSAVRVFAAALPEHEDGDNYNNENEHRHDADDDERGRVKPTIRSDCRCGGSCRDDRCGRGAGRS